MTATARTLCALLGAGLVVLAGCTGDSERVSVGEFQDPQVSAAGLRLVAYESCEEAATQLRAATRAQVGPWGLGVVGDGADLAVPDAGDAAEFAEAPGAAQQAPAAPGPPGAGRAAPETGAGDGAHSGTNVHEAGVDEPDLVKTDGRRILTISQGVLRVIDAVTMVETGTLNLAEVTTGATGGIAPAWAPADLLLHGDHALVLMQAGWYDYGAGAVPEARGLPERPGGGDSPAPSPVLGPRLLLVDLAGPPQVVSQYTVDGNLVDARAVGPTVRVVVRSGPRLAFPQVEPDATEEDRVAAYQAAVDEAELSDWLPRYELTAGGSTAAGQVDCTAVSRPVTYTGTSMLTVLTFDLAAPELGDGSPVSVVADGDTVYSNGTNLYVAVPDPAAEGTTIHKFDASQPGVPVYAASGTVPGWLINQYALSEWDGHLRVATTTGQTQFGQETDSESAVYVLAEQEGALVEVGSVTGLGKSERIYSVRFTGPVAYVVTFRETDPLYTVNLADPTDPQVLGELKITGYSAYLHPVGPGRLIGVGQEADQQGVIQGTQVSLFDVSDLTDPGVLAQHHVPSGHSEAEFDPHAFLWWPADQLLVIPLTSYEGTSEALVLQVADTGFTELTRISHPAAGGGEYGSMIRRSLVAQGALWTLSDAGLAAHALPGLTPAGWIPFA